MQYLRIIILIIGAFCAAMATSQTRIRLVHEVEKGETLNSIAQRYKVEVDAVVALNPDIPANPDKKLKRGYLINIPEAKAAVSRDTFKLAVVLPLSAEGKEGERSVEYYRGLLMAVDAERQKGRCFSVTAIDEPGVKEGMTDAIAALTVAAPHAIVGPLYPTHFQALATYANAYRVKTVIPFSSKVSQVENNPYLYLLNTPQQMVQPNSFELFKSRFSGCRCVVVRTVDASEATLVNYWVDNMLRGGYEVQTLAQAFTNEQLAQALSKERRNVFVIDGSNAQAVVNILQRIYDFTKTAPGYKISVVGHNAWQQFTMEHSELLSQLDTYVLAHDFYNAYSKSVIDFEERYFSWFKEYPLLLHPRMGELGYDTGCFLFAQQAKPTYLQTNFNFKQVAPQGGYANTSLMFVHFTPDNKVELIELKK